MDASSITHVSKIGYAKAVAGSRQCRTDECESRTESVQFSEKAMAMMEAHNVRKQEVDRFADIILRARAQNGYADPKGFLAGLNNDEMDLLQRAHGLADPIQRESLDFEGAYNLLLPHDEARDVNHDALLSIGAGKTITFPPQNAPESVKAAWKEATAGMSDMERLSYELHMFASEHLKNIHQGGDGRATIFEPGEPGYRVPFGDDGFSYQAMVAAQLEALTAARNGIPLEQWQRDERFLNSFAEALKRHGAA